MIFPDRELGPGVSLGHGKCHASFGELIQGRLPSGEDFLVTLPVNLWSQSVVESKPLEGETRVICSLSKSQKIAQMLLEKLEVREGIDLKISFDRNIPVGKGLSSSTADMLSTVRAMQELFGFLLRPDGVSNLFREIEPHDALMYKSSVVYDHRRGELLDDLDYVPPMQILAIDFGGTVDTVSFNRSVEFEENELHQYEELLGQLKSAMRARNLAEIAKVATAATVLYASRKGSQTRESILKALDEFGALGVVNTHSGTCVGLIYEPETEEPFLLETADRVRKHFGAETFFTRTLPLLK